MPFSNPRFKLGRRTKKLPGLPVYVNYTDRGMTSWTFRVRILGRPLSWNSRTRKWKFDTPGWGHVEFDGPAPPMADKVDEMARRMPYRGRRRR